MLPFENEDDRASFSKYFTPTVIMLWLMGKVFFDVPIKNKEETFEKMIEITKNNNYTTGNLLDYEYFSNN